ncbi:MAG: DUF3084 domain-containing protein [Candidatus Eremiobacteraeota bacterium]|nr:DUF3084 domain-containing protein [Candidatus Eremiobacteraeota bacterium]
MGTLGGTVLIVAFTLVAGAIAYIGDRVGHQIGRKRLTLFNLRPKYTSTIIAVATGMAIALLVTASSLLFSQYARAAFFHLDEINNRVNQLQAEADSLNKRVRESNVVVNRGDLLYEQYLPLESSQARADRLKRLAAFFDAVVLSLNRRYVPLGLKPVALKSSDPAVRRQFDALLTDQRVQGFLLTGPVIVIAIADQNLFVNDPIHFGLQPYADRRIFAAHVPIASIEVDGGTKVVPQIAYAQLSTAVQDAAITAGMPSPFARPLPALSTSEVETTRRQIRDGRGRFYIVARTPIDVYPHTGGIPVSFELSRTPR